MDKRHAMWAKRPVSGIDPPAHALRDRYEDTVQVSDVAAAFEAGRRMILEYDVYPESVLRPEVIGDTIAPGSLVLQHFRMGGSNAIAGIRIHTIADDPEGGVCSLAYRTLKGHPERGEISFTLTRKPDGLHYVIEAWSVPGVLLVKLFHKAVRKMQLEANALAVRRMVECLLHAGGGGTVQEIEEPHN